MIRLGDIAHVTRGPADPAQPMFRVNGQDGIGLAIAMRKGGDVLALGRNVEHAMKEIKANLPVGIEPTLIADQPVTVEHAVDDFMEALWEADRNRPRRQPPRPRPARRRRRGPLDPARPRRRVRHHVGASESTFSESRSAPSSSRSVSWSTTP